MPWTSEHIKWMTNCDPPLKSSDGRDIEIWDFNHQEDDAILSVWAKHFRNHYCLDTDIDLLSQPRSRRDFLNDIKFPNMTAPGPSIRAGDFGEILVADYLQYILNFWIPRIRWSSKAISNESVKGSDVIGFQFKNLDGTANPSDVLFVFEAKTKFSNSGGNRLQIAINDSAKDQLRIDESLNYLKQRLYEKQNVVDALKIERFQSPVDNPYDEKFGAAAIISEEFYDSTEIESSDCTQIPKSNSKTEFMEHPKKDKLVLVVIKGPDMMTLVHELYKRAADEA